MCGLFALADWSGLRPEQADWASAARDELRRRGPDHDAVMAMDGGLCVLAHTRLSILDPTPASDQPMVDPQTGVAIVFNGEIYNFHDLRRGLRDKGVAFASSGDTETILKLYVHEGIEALARLRGMYAFALWDPRDRSLTVARDPFGIKPLYLWNEGRAVAAASQIRALAVGLPQARQDPDAVLEYALFGHLPEARTPILGVTAATPGRIVQYRDGAPVRSVVIADLKTLFAIGGGARDDAPRVAAALQESVAAHTLSDVPIGILLSNGMDSSAIASRLAATADAPSIQAFTIGFETGPGGEGDERAGAARIAGRLGFPSITEAIGEQDLADGLAGYFQSMDCPTVDAVNIYFASRLVARNGIKLALTGVGGDELLGGYPTFRRTARIMSPAGGAGLQLARLMRGLGLKLPFNAAKLDWLLACRRTVAGAYLVQRGVCDPQQAARTYGCDEAQAKQAWERVHAALHEETRGVRDLWSTISLLETRFYLIGRLLRDADWAGMAHSVELRTPLVDWVLWSAARPLLATAPGRRPGSKRAQLAPALAPGVAELVPTAKHGFENPYGVLARLAGHDAAAAPNQQTWARHVLDAWTRSVAAGRA